MNHKRTVLTIGAAAIIAVSVAVASLAQSGQGAATDELQQIAAKPTDTAVVAIVNGQPILRRSIDIEAALALPGDVRDSAGRPTAGVSREELLDRQVENVLLVQAARKAGVVVTDSEVTLMINSGLIGPLTSKDMPEEQKRTGLAMLTAAGVTLDSAVDDPTIREAFRDFVAVQRYVGSSKLSRDELLQDAVSNATIEKHIDVLNAPH